MNTTDNAVPSTAVTNISVPYPQAADLHLWLGVGACHLRVVPGEGPVWVSGTYHDPSGSLPIQVEQRDGMVRITQLQNWTNIAGLFNYIPTLDIVISNEKPFALTLETAASDSYIDLGGLPLTQVTMKQGANKSEINFSSPNPIEMNHLILTAGAGGVELKNLANANFAEMRVEGGAAEFKLDFSGTARRRGHAKIPAGLASIAIDVPTTTPAKIVGETVMGGMHVGGPLTEKDGALWTNAGLATDVPQLVIEASVALGSLSLRAI